MLPNGDKTFVGNTYTIDSVRRQADGVYICTASNNIGTTVNEEIDLNILCKYTTLSLIFDYFKTTINVLIF